MDSHMGSDVVSLAKRCDTVFPLAGQAQVVLGLAANVGVFDVVVQDLGIVKVQET